MSIWKCERCYNDLVERGDKVIEKTCIHCEKPSYSSNQNGEWICPYCGEDMTDIPVNDQELNSQL